jgi:hypothetical protein
VANRTLQSAAQVSQKEFKPAILDRLRHEFNSIIEQLDTTPPELFAVHSKDDDQTIGAMLREKMEKIVGAFVRIQAPNSDPSDWGDYLQDRKKYAEAKESVGNNIFELYQKIQQTLPNNSESFDDIS